MPLNLQPVMPAVVTPYSQTIATDIDGDGLNELIIFDNTLLQLAIVHQFKYTDFTLSGINSTVWPNSNSPIWTTDTSPHWMTTWASQQAAVPGGWTIAPGDVIMAADLDGDGIAELFIYNLTTSTFGVLKWQTSTNQLQTIYKTTNITNIGVMGAQYFVVPNLHAIVSTAPANAAGILYYNPLSKHMGMGMFYYSPGSGFVPCWTFSGSSLNGWNLAASTPAANQFYPGCFSAAGTPTVVVYDPADAYIALLQWDGSNFGAVGGQGHNVGGWSFGSTDQLQCADFDGDGLTEILIYNPGTRYLGILEWDNTNNNFQAPVVTPGPITNGSNNWTIGSNDKYYCLNHTAGSPAQILAFSPESLNVALLVYDSGKLVCQWSGSSLETNNDWPVTASDSFYVGSPSAAPPLFTLSNQGPANALVPTLGAVAASATGLQIVSSATVPVQAWSPAFVAAAPKTGFTPFQSGNQPAIYTYISSLFPVPGQPGLNQPIRTLYTNADYQGKFQPYAVTLAAVTSPAQIPSNWPAHPTNWSTGDWTTVVNTIVNECNQVDTVYSLYGELGSLAGAMNAFQTNDFDTVKQNIQGITPNIPSEFNYWIGESVVGCLWVLAASAGIFFGPTIPPLAVTAFGVFFTMAGSIAGAAFGYDPTQQESFPFDDVQHQLTETLAASFVTQSLDLTAFLGDPVKLNICDGLSSSEWAIPTSLPSALQRPFQEMDRLWMYQQLVPGCLTIVMMLPGRIPIDPLYFSNGVAYYFNVALTRDDFKASAFYKDLFSTLRVSKEDFFAGIGAWAAIPREIVTN